MPSGRENRAIVWGRTLTAIDEAAAFAAAMYLEGKQAHAFEARAILNRMNDALGVMLDEQL